ncbi:MAG: helix-turn-helix transcriptional regulator [Lutibacter sp.]|nr:helix-turn-helix transcriptional regulator [Lutibacter sp.]MDT8417066.1 helix-turn-helix transcriptional regulator [Lutibacter sp.]
MDEKYFSNFFGQLDPENRDQIPNTDKLFLEITNQVADLFSVGPFYYYVLNFKDLSVDIVHKGTQDILGIDPNQLTFQKEIALMHPDDLAKLHEKELASFNFLLNKIPVEDIPFYKVIYMLRLKHTDGHYKTILHQAKVLKVTKKGQINQVLVIHTDISPLNIPFNHNVSIICNNKPSYQQIDMNFVTTNFKLLFTKKEIEIINKLAQGANFKEIAALFFVSPHTIKTHRKNILKKSGCKNTPELVAKCIREGVI